MLFADDIIFIDENRDEINIRLEQWRHTLKSRGFKISRSKIEYLRCSFSGVEDDSGKVTIDGIAVPRVEKFRYLDLIIQGKGDIDKDINVRMKVF